MVTLPETEVAEVLFTEVDWRIVKMCWRRSKLIIIQHSCPEGYINKHFNRDFPDEAWINWRGFHHHNHNAIRVLDQEITYCTQCQKIPSEGLRAMYLFLVI